MFSSVISKVSKYVKKILGKSKTSDGTAGDEIDMRYIPRITYDRPGRKKSILHPYRRSIQDPRPPPEDRKTAELRKKQLAAIRMQRIVRGFLGRIKSKRKYRLALDSAKDYWRGYNNRLRWEKEKLKISARVKSELATTFVSGIVANVSNAIVRNYAAITLQRVWRGYYVRLHPVVKPVVHAIYRPLLHRRFTQDTLRRVWVRRHYQPAGGWPGKCDVLKYDMWTHIDQPPKGRSYGMRTHKVRGTAKNFKESEILRHDKNAWYGLPISVVSSDEATHALKPQILAFVQESPYAVALSSPPETKKKVSYNTLGWTPDYLVDTEENNQPDEKPLTPARGAKKPKSKYNQRFLTQSIAESIARFGPVHNDSIFNTTGNMVEADNQHNNSNQYFQFLDAEKSVSNDTNKVETFSTADMTDMRENHTKMNKSVTFSPTISQSNTASKQANDQSSTPVNHNSIQSLPNKNYSQKNTFDKLNLKSNKLSYVSPGKSKKASAGPLPSHWKQESIAIPRKRTAVAAAWTPKSSGEDNYHGGGLHTTITGGLGTTNSSWNRLKSQTRGNMLQKTNTRLITRQSPTLTLLSKYGDDALSVTSSSTESRVKVWPTVQRKHYQLKYTWVPQPLIQSSVNSIYADDLMSSHTIPDNLEGDSRFSTGERISGGFYDSVADDYHRPVTPLDAIEEEFRVNSPNYYALETDLLSTQRRPHPSVTNSVHGNSTITTMSSSLVLGSKGSHGEEAHHYHFY